MIEVDLVSAMELNECAEPRTLIFWCVDTNSCNASIDRGSKYALSPNEIFPLQLEAIATRDAFECDEQSAKQSKLSREHRHLARM